MIRKPLGNSLEQVNQGNHVDFGRRRFLAGSLAAALLGIPLVGCANNPTPSIPAQPQQAPTVLTTAINPDQYAFLSIPLFAANQDSNGSVEYKTTGGKAAVVRIKGTKLYAITTAMHLFQELPEGYNGLALTMPGNAYDNQLYIPRTSSSLTPIKPFDESTVRFVNTNFGNRITEDGIFAAIVTPDVIQFMVDSVQRNFPDAVIPEYDPQLNLLNQLQVGGHLLSALGNIGTNADNSGITLDYEPFDGEILNIAGGVIAGDMDKYPYPKHPAISVSYQRANTTDYPQAGDSGTGVMYEGIYAGNIFGVRGDKTGYAIVAHATLLN